MRRLFERLRNETKPYHEQMECGALILQPDLSIEDYGRVLETFYGFYAPWELCAAPELDRLAPGFLESRRKAQLLASDLRSLGKDPTQTVLCSDLPRLTGAGGLLGSAYVLEGATLGGRVICQTWSPKLQTKIGAGRRFFHGYGPETGQRWREFGELLESHSGPEFDDRAIASAVATFIRLHAWFAHKGIVKQ